MIIVSGRLSGGACQPFVLDVKGGEKNGIAINAKGGDCWQYGITGWH